MVDGQAQHHQHSYAKLVIDHRGTQARPTDSEDRRFSRGEQRREGVYAMATEVRDAEDGPALLVDAECALPGSGGEILNLVMQ